MIYTWHAWYCTRPLAIADSLQMRVYNRYRKPGWLWTDLHYFHKYLHNDELNSRFHIGIGKYHVRASHIMYIWLLLIVIFWYIFCWTLSKVTPPFGVTLDTQCIPVFLRQIVFRGSKFALSGWVNWMACTCIHFK